MGLWFWEENENDKVKTTRSKVKKTILFMNEHDLIEQDSLDDPAPSIM